MSNFEQWRDNVVKAILREAEGAEQEARVEATLENRGKPFSGGVISRAAVKAAVVAAFEESIVHIQCVDDVRDLAQWIKESS